MKRNKQPSSFQLFFGSIIVLVIVSFFSNCDTNMFHAKKHSEGIFYYTSFAGYNVPLRPINEISKETLHLHRAYYVGHYNAKGQLYQFEKFLDGKLEFQHFYTYGDDNRLIESKVINAEKKVRIKRFD